MVWYIALEIYDWGNLNPYSTIKIQEELDYFQNYSMSCFKSQKSKIFFSSSNLQRYRRRKSVHTNSLRKKKAPISGKCKLFSSRNEKSTLSFHIPKKLIKLLLVWLRGLKLLTLNIYTLKRKISRYWSSSTFFYFHIQYGCLNIEFLQENYETTFNKSSYKFSQ